MSPAAASSVACSRHRSSRRRSSLLSVSNSLASSAAAKIPEFFSSFGSRGQHGRSMRSNRWPKGQRRASHSSDFVTGTAAAGGVSSPWDQQQQLQQRRDSCLSEPFSGSLHVQSSQQRQRKSSCLSESGTGWQTEEFVEYERQRRHSANSGEWGYWPKGAACNSGLQGRGGSYKPGCAALDYGGTTRQRRLSFAPSQQQLGEAEGRLLVGLREGVDEGRGKGRVAELEQQRLLSGYGLEGGSEARSFAGCRQSLAAAANSSSEMGKAQPQTELSVGSWDMLGRSCVSPMIPGQHQLSRDSAMKVSGFWEEEEGCVNGSGAVTRSSAVTTVGSTAAAGDISSGVCSSSCVDSSYLPLTEAALAVRHESFGATEVEEWVMHGVRQPAVTADTAGSKIAALMQSKEGRGSVDKVGEAEPVGQQTIAPAAKGRMRLRTGSTKLPAAGEGWASSSQTTSAALGMPPLPPAAAAAVGASGEGRMDLMSLAPLLGTAGAPLGRAPSFLPVQDSSSDEVGVPLGIDEEAEDVGKVSLQQQWEQQQAARRARRMSRRASYIEELPSLFSGLGGVSGPCTACGGIPLTAAGLMMGVVPTSVPLAAACVCSSGCSGVGACIGTGTRAQQLPLSSSKVGSNCQCGSGGAEPASPAAGVLAGGGARFLKAGTSHAPGAAEGLELGLQSASAPYPCPRMGSDGAWGLGLGAAAAGTTLGTLREASSFSSASSRGTAGLIGQHLQSPDRPPQPIQQAAALSAGVKGNSLVPGTAAAPGPLLSSRGAPCEASVGTTGGWEVYSQMAATAASWGPQPGLQQQRRRRASMPAFSSSEAAWAWAAASQKAMRKIPAGVGTAVSRRRRSSGLLGKDGDGSSVGSLGQELARVVQEGSPSSVGTAAASAGRKSLQWRLPVLLAPCERRQPDEQRREEQQQQQGMHVRRRRASASVVEGGDSLIAWRKWCEVEEAQEAKYQIAMGCFPLGDTVKAAGAGLKQHIRRLSWTAAEAASCCFGNSSSFPSEALEGQQQQDEEEMRVPLLASSAAAEDALHSVEGSRLDGEGSSSLGGAAGRTSSNASSATAAAGLVGGDDDSTAAVARPWSCRHQVRGQQALSTINSGSSQTAPSPGHSVEMAIYPRTASAALQAGTPAKVAAAIKQGRSPGMLSHEGSWELDGACAQHLQQQQQLQQHVSVETARMRRWSNADGLHALRRDQQKKQEQQEGQVAELSRQTSATTAASISEAGAVALAPQAAAALAATAVAAVAEHMRPSLHGVGDWVSESHTAGGVELGTVRSPGTPAVIAQRRFSYDVVTGSYVIGPVKAQHKIEVQQKEVQVDSYLEQQEAMHLSGTVKYLQEQSTASDTRTPSDTSRASGPGASQVVYQQQLSRGNVGRRSTQGSGLSAAEAAQLHAAMEAPEEAEGVLRLGLEGPRPYYVAKLCDFGLSKALSCGQSAKQTVTMGTITHQPPEVLEHGLLGPAADVYAYGILSKLLGKEGTELLLAYGGLLERTRISSPCISDSHSHTDRGTIE